MILSHSAQSIWMDWNCEDSITDHTKDHTKGRKIPDASGMDIIYLLVFYLWDTIYVTNVYVY